ncbi:MAG: hypothetical protein ACFE94_05210 [Candidatus Hodarchaeota archaeon]
MIIIIEVLNRKKKIIGYVEKKKFFNRKQTLIGFLDGYLVKNENGHILLKLDDHDDIFIGNEMVGFILNSTIYFREEPVFEFSKEKREIYSKDGKDLIVLKGNHQDFEDLDLFGIAIIYLKNKWWEKIYRYY